VPIGTVLAAKAVARGAGDGELAVSLATVVSATAVTVVSRVGAATGSRVALVSGACAVVTESDALGGTVSAYRPGVVSVGWVGAVSNAEAVAVSRLAMLSGAEAESDDALGAYARVEVSSAGGTGAWGRGRLRGVGAGRVLFAFSSARATGCSTCVTCSWLREDTANELSLARLVSGSVRSVCWAELSFAGIPRSRRSEQAETVATPASTRMRVFIVPPESYWGPSRKESSTYAASVLWGGSRFRDLLEPVTAECA
jgi:hypothetical protein